MTLTPSLELSPDLPCGENIGPCLEPNDSFKVAGRKVWKFQLNEMLSHEEGTRLGEDIEELHDMRVATRRMRAAFDLFGEAFKPKTLKPHLKGLQATGRVLGKVRDIDVFIEKAGMYLSTLPEEEKNGLDPLLDQWSTERNQARDKLLIYLNGKEYMKFKERFSAFLEKPQKEEKYDLNASPKPDRVRHLAPVMIYTHLAAVRAYDCILDTASITQLHALRIEFKKLRYSFEFFQDVLGPEGKAVINDLKKIQDHLGNLNDANIATLQLQEFIDQWSVRQSKLPVYLQRSSSGVMMYLTFRYSERHQLMTTFSKIWADLFGSEFLKNIARAVSVL